MFNEETKMNRLTRFNRPAGTHQEYMKLERDRYDRLEARYDALVADRRKLVERLKEIIAYQHEDAKTAALLRELGEE